MLWFTDPFLLRTGAPLCCVWVVPLCILFPSILSVYLCTHLVAITQLLANFEFCIIGNIFIATIHVIICFSYLNDGPSVNHIQGLLYLDIDLT